MLTIIVFIIINIYLNASKVWSLTIIDDRIIDKRAPEFRGEHYLSHDLRNAYHIGPNSGLITFTFPADKRPDTKNDLLALGFQTRDENALLVRIESGTSDYMELALVDGNVLMVYNLGIEDLDVGELSFRVNDDKYHTVRFTRSAQNSTIQVDNHHVVHKSPPGRQLTIFNSHSRIQLGGKRNIVRNTIDRPFHGIIAGFVFNGHRILDMAVKDDPRISIDGDVKLLVSIDNSGGSGGGGGNNNNSGDKKDSIININHDYNYNNNNSRTTGGIGSGSEHHHHHHHQQQHLGSSYYENSTLMETSGPQMQEAKTSVGYDINDLIYSGAGSGCFDADDEDDCSRMEASGGGDGGDDLITPVYIASPRSPVTGVPPYSLQSTPHGSVGGVVSHKCDADDEDCIDGSGSGELIGGQQQHITSSSNNIYYGSGGAQTSLYAPHMTTTTVSAYHRPQWTVGTPRPPPLYPEITPPYYPIDQQLPDHMSTAVNNPFIVYTTQRPITQQPIWDRPIYKISGTTRQPSSAADNRNIGRPAQLPESKDPPTIYQIPVPEIPKIFVKEPAKPSTPVPNKSTSDRTVMIIGLIAIGLIVVVIIAPIVLFFKVRYRTDTQFKINDDTINKSHYQFQPVSGSTSSMLATGGLPQTHLIGGGGIGGGVGMSRTSPTTDQHHKPLIKMPKKKDLKEWYV
ncbi:neurexin-3-beta-like [Oppia nitens]|uniref:neurexin-3-beta-like n=1 Tax=Oppia nitens TaxID=1686743 RepID=UPI0023DB8B16|nr:neurexin-3-beta-like [Oppia nitens]